MKIIKLFLILTIVSLSSSELTLPKCIKYESIIKVIDNDWTFASERIEKFMEDNATKYVGTFMNLIDKSLVRKTDSEYIKEQLQRHEEYLDWNITYEMTESLENMVDYEKTLHKEITYDIYSFDMYKPSISPELYRGVYLYIRYLESKNKFNESFNIYHKIAKRFLNTYNVENKISINIMILNIKLEEYIRSLEKSLKNPQYSSKQKQILYEILSKFLLDKNLFSKMLLSEKNELFKYLDMFYLDSNTTADSILKSEKFFKGMLKIVKEKNLRRHLNNKGTMQQMVTNYKLDIEQIHQKLLQFKTKKEYEDYSEERESVSSIFDYWELPRIFTLYIIDNIQYISLSHIFKYEFSSSEFIEFVRKPYIFYGKPWIYGKYKFEYKERVEKNKKFLELLK